MKFSGSRTVLILSVIVLAVAASLGTFRVLSKGQEQHTQHEDLVSSNAVHPGARLLEATNATTYDVKELSEQVVHQCPAGDLPCLDKVLGMITARNGPRASMSVLQKRQSQGQPSSATDQYHFAHEIGRKTAERFGISGEAFLMCPTTFNDACQNGFFQYALGQAKATASVAQLTCGSLDRSSTERGIFSCHLGLGHGVLVAQNHNLINALVACDTLETPTGQSGCRQGVFIENGSTTVQGSKLRDGFSQTDPLAPCNVVPDKYRGECFMNHAGRLMEFFNNDVKNASHACLKASEAYRSSCLRSIGLMVSHPSWQPLLSRNTGTKTPEAIAWELCLTFPRGHREPCVISAVDTILNSDEFEVARAKTFCNMAGVPYRVACYHRVGYMLRSQVTDPKLIREKCATLRDAHAGECLQGAGEKIKPHHDPAPKVSVHEMPGSPPDEVVQAASEDIFKNDAALYRYVKRFGLAQTITHLHKLASQYGNCHTAAHQAGRFAYNIFSKEAFRTIPGECHAGGFHGAVEAYFKERGATHLSDDVKIICRSELNAFNSHQCMHGIGHGLMAATNYELPEALEKCNALKDRQGSCWTGVFMENIVGGLGGHEGHAGHTTKYLNDNPHYPCTMVAEKYKSACYFLQPSRMVQLFAADFGRVGLACANAPAQFQNVCFQSMGREVSGTYKGRVAGAIQSCTNAPKDTPRINCLIGAVQDTFWDPAGQDPALAFCALLNAKAEKDACYETIFSRAPQILLTTQEIQGFCAKAEAPYRTSCLKKRTVFS